MPRTDHPDRNQAVVKLRKLKLYQAFFSDHNAVKIRYQLQETNCKKHKHIEANSMLLSNQEVTEEVKKKNLETNVNENMTTMDCSKSSAKTEVYSETSLPQKMRKTSHKQPNLTPNATRERRKPTGRN